MDAMRKADMATMEDARDYPEREWGIRYKNGKEHGWLLRETPSACGRPGAGGTARPMPSNSSPAKKLWDPDQAPEAFAGGGRAMRVALA
jgi:hypothetical protein